MGWKRYFDRKRRDDDFASELEAYVAHEVDNNIARGMDSQRARDAALRKLGNRTLLQEEIYKMNSLGFVENIWQDLRYGARMLRTNPGFTAVAVLSLALGIGANAALFQLIDAVLLKSLPVKAPEQLVRIEPLSGSGHWGDVNYRPNDLTNPQWEFLRSSHGPFQNLLAWGRNDFNISEAGAIRLAKGLYVSGDFFAGLGVPALIGRTIGPEDDRRGCGTSAAVISYSFWQREFGGSPSILSRTISLDGHRFPIIGVTVPEFTGINVGEQFDVAVPICSEFLGGHSALDERAFWWLGAFGRLKPGMPASEANAFMRSISPELYRATVSPNYRPDIAKEYLKLRLEAVPGNTGFSTLRQSVETPLLVLFSLAGLVLLIACANLVNLLLARATVREHEIAVRLAVGAPRWRVVQQLLSESLLTAALGSAAGTALAVLLSRYLVSAFSTSRDALFLQLAFDSRFVGFLIAITLLTCVLFGLAPALRASRRQPGAAMKRAGRGATSARERFSLQRLLVVAQISLSLILLVGSLLFVRSFQKLMTLDPGFRANGVLIAGVGFRADAIPQERRMPLFDAILHQLRSIQGVDSAAAVNNPPISGGYSNDNIHIDGDTVDHHLTNFNRVSEGYFRTMAIPSLAGRDFTPHDDKSSTLVAVVDSTFTANFLGGKNPIGRTLYSLPDPGQPIKRYTIVGLVGKSKYPDLERNFEPTVYITVRQRDDLWNGMGFVVHSDMALAPTMKAVERAVMSVNPQLSVDLRSFPVQIHDAVRREDVMAKLSGFFGLLAVILATVGLYGVMSYIVTHRRSEIGIRLAIGATPKSILAMILKQSLLLLALGVAAGAVLSLLCSRWAQSLLFEVQANDPWIIVTAARIGPWHRYRRSHADSSTASRESRSDDDTERRIGRAGLHDTCDILLARKHGRRHVHRTGLSLISPNSHSRAHTWPVVEARDGV